MSKMRERQQKIECQKRERESERSPPNREVGLVSERERERERESVYDIDTLSVRYELSIFEIR